MLIIGAGGCASDLLTMLEMESDVEELLFYDDVTPDSPDLFYDKYPILHNAEAARNHFQDKDDRFVIAVGSPKIRHELTLKFEELGGRCVSLISSNAQIGNHVDVSQRGVIIMHGTIITNNVQIHDGCLINMHCTIGHGAVIERFCELSPGVIFSNSHIGEFTHLAMGARILQNLTIGSNVMVGAGSVVTRDVTDGTTVVGVPAREIGE